MLKSHNTVPATSLGIRRPLMAIVVLSLAFNQHSAADNWPSWRGSQGDGISSEQGFPTSWSRYENVAWKTPLPEPGNSTPIVWEDRVFVTQSMENGKRRTVICFDRTTGKQLWQSGVDAVEMERSHKTNPYCSPSPVTDGERVIAWFGSVGLVAFDFQGDLQWRRPLGRADHVFGYGGSPVLHNDLCFLNFAPGTHEKAVAVDKTTGEIVWQVDLPEISDQHRAQLEGNDVYGTWSTPVVIDDQVIFCVRDSVVAYEPSTGRELWKCRGLGPQMKSSPIAGEGVVVAFGGKDSSTLAIRLGGHDDISESHVLWRKDVAQSRLGTGVIHGGHIYTNRSNGVVECIELQSGRVIWQKRLRGTSDNGATWSSLFLADGKIFAINQAADVFVLAASPDYNLVATNSLGEQTNSTLIGSQGNLFIRTHDALWCIGKE
jgi:outer membrane protein assembly factor BamB